MSDATIPISKPRLEPAAAGAIARLEAETGRRLSPAHVVWLQDAARKLVRPDRESPKLIDLPTDIGGALLWPFSYAALQWYSTVAEPAFGWDFRAVGYTLAHSFRLDVLRALPSERTVRKAVNAWLMALECSPAALRDAVDGMLGRDEIVRVRNIAPAPKPVVSAEDWGDVIALLCRRFPGTEPMYWAGEVSIAYCQEMAVRSSESLPEDRRPIAFDASAEFHCIVAAIRAEVTA